MDMQITALDQKETFPVSFHCTADNVPACKVAQEGNLGSSAEAQNALGFPTERGMLGLFRWRPNVQANSQPPSHRVSFN